VTRIQSGIEANLRNPVRSGSRSISEAMMAGSMVRCSQTLIAFGVIHGFEDRNAHPGRNRRAQGRNFSGLVRNEQDAAPPAAVRSPTLPYPLPHGKRGRALLGGIAQCTTAEAVTARTDPNIRSLASSRNGPTTFPSQNEAAGLIEFRSQGFL
jgi:hypothetical protein